MLKRINKPLLISFFVGIILMAAGWLYLQQQIAAASQDTRTVVVPVRTLPRYHQITEEDVTTRTVPKGTVPPAVAASPTEVIGKTALTVLYEGEPVRRERLTSTPLQGYRYVNVLVDLARAGGAQPGDIVDAYLVAKEAAITTQVAWGALVVNVWDGQGNPLYTDRGPANKPPAVVRLAVRPEDAARIVDGAIPGATSIVLVVTDSEGGIARGVQQLAESSEPAPGKGAGEGAAGTDTQAGDS